MNSKLLNLFRNMRAKRFENETKYKTGLQNILWKREVHYAKPTSFLNEKLHKERFNFDFEDNFYDAQKVINSSFWQKKIRTVHNLLDVNKDGIISYDDFNVLADRFIDFGHLSGIQRNKFRKIIENMWTEQWGCINPYNLVTVEQYLQDMQHIIADKDRRKTVHTILPHLFSAVDKDQDGAISFYEFQLFFKCLGLTYKNAIVSFESIDVNKDGLLTLKEFVTLGREFFISSDEQRASKLFWGPLVL